MRSRSTVYVGTCECNVLWNPLFVICKQVTSTIIIIHVQFSFYLLRFVSHGRWSALKSIRENNSGGGKLKSSRSPHNHDHLVFLLLLKRPSPSYSSQQAGTSATHDAHTFFLHNYRSPWYLSPTTLHHITHTT